MTINIINGSQKIGESNTGRILDNLCDIIKDKHEIKNFNIGKGQFSSEMLKNIITGDIIVLAFPLFADSLPSKTLNILIELENIIKKENVKNLIIYTIVNNGFYEGRQNHIAIEIVKNWCVHSGVKFGGGIGQGAGEMIGQTKEIPFQKGPFNNLWRALLAMVEKMEKKETFEIIYLSPYFPRFMWKVMANRYWHNMAKKNGVKKKDIKRKL